MKVIIKNATFVGDEMLEVGTKPVEVSDQVGRQLIGSNKAIAAPAEKAKPKPSKAAK